MSECLDAMQWCELLDSGITSKASSEVQAHLASCSACREVYTRLQQTERQLGELATFARAELSPAQGQIEDARERVMSQWSHTESELNSVTDETLTLGRLLLLQRLVRPACGAQMASLAIVQAARRADVASIPAKRWNAFLACLAELMAVMCGETLSRMIMECGRQIP